MSAKFAAIIRIQITVDIVARKIKSYTRNIRGMEKPNKLAIIIINAIRTMIFRVLGGTLLQKKRVSAVRCSIRRLFK